MASKLTAILLLLLPLLLTPTPATSSVLQNVSTVYEKFPNYHYWFSYLDQANITARIAKHNAITILALDDGTSGQFHAHNLGGNETINDIFFHVILDYIDEARMKSATEQPVTLATMFQTTGVPTGMTGFVKMQKGPDGKVRFGSAVPGSQINTTVLGTVTTVPPYLSILHIDQIIVPPNIFDIPVRAGPMEDDPPAPAASVSATSPASSSQAATPSAATSAAPAASPKANSTGSAASAPKASTASATKSSASTAPEASTAESTAPEAASGPTTMADGPSAAGGPGAADGPAASGVGRVAYGAGVGMGVIGAVAAAVLSL